MCFTSSLLSTSKGNDTGDVSLILKQTIPVIFSASSLPADNARKSVVLFHVCRWSSFNKPFYIISIYLNSSCRNYENTKQLIPTTLENKKNAGFPEDFRKDRKRTTKEYRIFYLLQNVTEKYIADETDISQTINSPMNRKKRQKRILPSFASNHCEYQ